MIAKAIGGRVDLIAGLATLLLCGGEGYALVGRSLVGLRSAIAESRALTLRMTGIEAGQAEIAQGIDLRDRLAATNAEFDRRFKVTNGFDSFYSEMLKQAGDQGLQLRSVNALPGAAEQGILHIPVHLQLAGTYEQFYSFMHLLFEQTSVLKLESLAIATTDDGPCEFDLTVALSRIEPAAGGGAL